MASKPSPGSSGGYIFFRSHSWPASGFVGFEAELTLRRGFDFMLHFVVAYLTDLAILAASTGARMCHTSLIGRRSIVVARYRPGWRAWWTRPGDLQQCPQIVLVSLAVAVTCRPLRTPPWRRTFPPLSELPAPSTPELLQFVQEGIFLEDMERTAQVGEEKQQTRLDETTSAPSTPELLQFLEEGCS